MVHESAERPLPESTISAIEATFRLCDGDGDGHITKKEATMLLRALGHIPTQKQCSEFLQELPNAITLDDFIDRLNQHYTPALPLDRLIGAFQTLEPSRTGVMAGDTLKELITTVGEKLSEAEVEEVFKDIKLDKDGNVHYVDLVEL
ncbi:calmodulin, putative [Perkinsus marinus ATCC 50983]|uniref:Calmodulin, putative n=1 Tax=Perkinsus marinus (strain ATCC 50983 / TXsc) TaxID=423536 RepID=C5KE42_PERM5|nr:calmodulin, putative [Perkinsus marinus ATCC 50983]EER17254.1 calmodulin, putative [Perkinsus marinus ATCC 50983]|eukprot:XP_002785458.1 calmodulin, putative [Perkinsus marinus ATCC 50983]